MLVLWSGGEKELGVGCCISRATVETVERASDLMGATGTFTLIDYVEGGVEDLYKWKATGKHNPENDRYEWVVFPNVEDGDFTWTDRNDEPIFTLQETVNNAIRVFIVETLLAAPEWLQDGAYIELGPPITTQAVEQCRAQEPCIISAPRKPPILVQERRPSIFMDPPGISRPADPKDPISKLTATVFFSQPRSE